MYCGSRQNCIHGKKWKSIEHLQVVKTSFIFSTMDVYNVYNVTSLQWTLSVMSQGIKADSANGTSISIAYSHICCILHVVFSIKLFYCSSKQKKLEYLIICKGIALFQKYYKCKNGVHITLFLKINYVHNLLFCLWAACSLQPASHNLWESQFQIQATSQRYCLLLSTIWMTEWEGSFVIDKTSNLANGCFFLL